MRVLWLRSMAAAAVVVLALALFVAGASSQSQPLTSSTQAPVSEIVLTLDPRQSKVHWMLDSTLHTVHGTFNLKSGTIHFNPETGTAGGEIVVSALSGESGNGSRDKRMHKEILETAKYPDAVFRPTHVEGKVNRSGRSDVKLGGILSIHGGEHDLTAVVHAELAGDHWSGTCKFDVPYVKWGIKDPSNFMLKVKPVAEVETEMGGEIAAGK